MLRVALAACALAGLMTAPALASGKKPPPASQSQDNGRDSDERPQRSQDAAPQPAYEPAYAAPAPAAGRYVVLTERQKRCGAGRGCDLDSRVPCPPCW